MPRKPPAGLVRLDAEIGVDLMDLLDQKAKNWGVSRAVAVARLIARALGGKVMPRRGRGRPPKSNGKAV
jgi:hypothetical protein